MGNKAIIAMRRNSSRKNEQFFALSLTHGARYPVPYVHTLPIVVGHRFDSVAGVSRPAAGHMGTPVDDGGTVARGDGHALTAGDREIRGGGGQGRGVDQGAGQRRGR